MTMRRICPVRSVICRSSPEFPTAMTGLQYLRFQTAVRERKSIEKGIRTAQRLGLNLEEKITKLSPMDKKKLGIAGALVHDPRVVLLDEPTRDLDQAARHCLAELIPGRERKRKIRGLGFERV